MTRLDYKVIESKRQYSQYCNILEDLLSKSVKSPALKEETELLTELIEKWDKGHTLLSDADPISLFHSLMKERSLKAKDLVAILNVSKGLVSDILNYKKGLSKDVIRALAGYFKVSQEAFNRPYQCENKS